ncbi:MAG: hypothetical protein HY534_07105 [Chloroflexi bacterium]|nr:hypothetical protein [Chloroflexota bacterium]
MVALAIALLLYTYVQNETNPSEIGGFEVPVDFVDIPPGLLAQATQAVPSVHVRVSAPRDALLGIRSSSLRAYVDLHRGRSGINEYPVGVELPDPRVRLLEVVPAELPVRLEEISEKRVPVRPNRTGAVPFGYEAGQVEIDPPEISISGPNSLIQRIASASVDIKFDGATVNMDASYAPILLDAQGHTVDPDGRAVRETPETVRVRIPITQQISYKTVPVRPTITGNIDSGYLIEGVVVDPPVITLVAPPQALRTADLVETAPVDVTDAATTLTRQVAFRIPEGVSLLGADNVRVTVRVTPLVVLQPFSLPVVAENVLSGLQVAGALPFVQAIMRGPSTSLRGADPTQAGATVDLAGLGPGLYELPVRVNAPPDLVLQSVIPSSVAVRLIAPETPQPPAPPTAVP